MVGCNVAVARNVDEVEYNHGGDDDRDFTEARERERWLPSCDILEIGRAHV